METAECKRIDKPVVDPENSRSRWLFSKISTKTFKVILCRSYANQVILIDINSSPKLEVPYHIFYNENHTKK